MFTRRALIGPDLEVIPTPGHTVGATMFLWDNGEHRFLFPGDTIWSQHGQWKAVVLDESDRSSYLDTLALVRDLDFAVLVPWGAELGQPYLDVVDPTQKRLRVEEIIARVGAGEDQ